MTLKRRYLDCAGAIRVGVLDRVGHEFIDQKPQRNGLVGRKPRPVSMAEYGVSRCCFLEFADCALSA